MFLTRPLSVLLLGALASASCLAVAASAKVQSEIDGLLGNLQSSGCEFNRNGTWHSPSEAKAHLQRKREYLEGKGLIKSAEDFITLGASESSSSGKAYLVRCGSGPAVASRIWLLQQLDRLRQGK
ncbi:MAG TPA: DUF5329 domain-containing protein [Accumulibacter sp.]|nr:DUF5329 domain-containing protein [Accumulibacter sp.]HMW16293.1 DUF5329 domain-containing protein [Accumulibacter sp.]HMX22174.1 DUF5329 domain-containing protein [Accumulibacter sp.]HMY05804.1 DUF5329 domain-containing protein [Accumulibacter sp.]HNC16944.1 DUF5329 domain-containing protein [Accumulibacter sp.]